MAECDRFTKQRLIMWKNWQAGGSLKYGLRTLRGPRFESHCATQAHACKVIMTKPLAQNTESGTDRFPATQRKAPQKSDTRFFFFPKAQQTWLGERERGVRPQLKKQRRERGGDRAVWSLVLRIIACALAQANGRERGKRVQSRSDAIVVPQYFLSTAAVFVCLVSTVTAGT